MMEHSCETGIWPARVAGKSFWITSFMVSATMLAGCGGGGGDSAQTQAIDVSKSTALATKLGNKRSAVSDAASPTRAEAIRFLNQATFGPTEGDIQRLMSIGYPAWLDEQFAMPVSANYYHDRYKSEDAAAKSGSTKSSARAGADTIYASFYTRAITAPDQLRQRMAYALSQFTVASEFKLSADYSEMMASYTDVLNRDAFGTYRSLLQDVSVSPAMGLYLSHIKNKKEDPRYGHIPDQNYAREIMQLFSIGLYKLNVDGTPALDVNGRTIDTYSQDDVIGLSKVFTGWSWGGPDTDDRRFYGNPDYRDANMMGMPMQCYSKWHSTSEKKFLGVTIPAQTAADCAASLKVALDTITAHKNAAPFLSRQLIQRFVSSNPSPTYVRRVALVFNNNGAGVRGDLKAVLRAILLDKEARSSTAVANDYFGKLREPVLRMTAYLRAYGAKSDSGRFLIGRTDDPGLALAQTPLRSDTVFNFYRPGYIAPTTRTGIANATAPEMQITSEASVSGYVNYMSGITERGGVGLRGPDNTGIRNDVQLDFNAEIGVSADSHALVDMVAGKLLGDQVPTALKTEIIAAVDSLPVPALNKDGTNQSWIDGTKRKRVNIALLLTLASHEFIVQR